MPFTSLKSDDEPIVRNFVRAIIQSQGYSFHVAADAEEALQMSRSCPDEIHLLITDIEMPGMKGKELAKILSVERPSLRTLLISGTWSDDVQKTDVKCSFLKKPFLPKDFTHVLQQLMDSPI